MVYKQKEKIFHLKENCKMEVTLPGIGFSAFGTLNVTNMLAILTLQACGCSFPLLFTLKFPQTYLSYLEIHWTLQNNNNWQ